MAHINQVISSLFNNELINRSCLPPVAGSASRKRRGPSHDGELRQAAGTAARAAAEKRGVTRLPPSHFTKVRAMSAYRPTPEVSLYRGK